MERTPTENSVGDATRIDEYCECLTRSEVYALVREVINKRKHSNDIDGVCDHIESVGFQAQIAYIREYIEKLTVITGDGRSGRKRLNSHIRRLENIFNLNKSLEQEYYYCTTVRNGGSEHAKFCRDHKQVRKQRSKQKQQ
ncbi:late expression factor 11 [Orgyia leucostigma nucleopolyhedrovirus]|uniref:Late expression factor 11 n=1 Tax=Orgyia leucostigma nucleopolyhedrovirus TaxID=490711 RepID=B0FDS3_9ABAC|nr:late expression factor 11 [Orgyia leucostigma nucleopolyhedrovirus]ABY65781.1 late expression factor 11 [Orgyia leucostigma nucleopolyhedrovirus]